MTFEPKNFDHLLGMQGFSDELLKNHFTLYQGYVKNVNTLMQENPFLPESKRRFGWEFNGMRLHELYFENMTPSTGLPTGQAGSGPSGNILEKIKEQFQTYENWEKEFKAVGAMRGIGWAILYFDPQNKNLFNVWVGEHDVGHLAGSIPLLVMDVFEHAFFTDYGIKRADYIEAFFRVIDWNVVEARLKGV